jgi:hypothetical protein
MNRFNKGDFVRIKPYKAFRTRKLRIDKSYKVENIAHIHNNDDENDLYLILIDEENIKTGYKEGWFDLAPDNALLQRPEKLKNLDNLK